MEVPTMNQTFWTLEKVAGFFEGDGSVCVSMSRLRGSKLKTYRPHIRFTQSQTGMLYDIRADVFPEMTRPHETSPKATALGGYPRAYTASFGMRAALMMLMKLIPHLKYRRPQAVLAFDLWTGWGRASRREDLLTDRERFIGHVIKVLNRPKRTDNRISLLERQFGVIFADVLDQAEATFPTVSDQSFSDMGDA